MNQKANDLGYGDEICNGKVENTHWCELAGSGISTL